MALAGVMYILEFAQSEIDSGIPGGTRKIHALVIRKDL
jgi:hypothetical protein